MPKLSMQIPHTLGREEAMRRIKEQLPKARNLATDLDEQWQDHTLTFKFTAMGFKVSGVLAVEEAVVNLDIELPLPAMFVKGTIEQRVRHELGTVLAIEGKNA
jgi:hypothetical protein